MQHKAYQYKHQFCLDDRYLVMLIIIKNKTIETGRFRINMLYDDIFFIMIGF